MEQNKHTPTILIAALPQHTVNYENAVKNSGFTYIYPSMDRLSQLTEISFDLLLLPGGGDISPQLYGSPAPFLTEHSETDTLCTPADHLLDLIQFQLLQLAYIRNKPILGICKGMQIINVYFGGDLYPHLPTADMHTQQSGDRMHPVFFAEDFPHYISVCKRNVENSFEHSFSENIYRLLTRFPEVNSAHHQGIRHLGKDLVTVQHSEDYLPETIAHRHLPILGLQWHPERMHGFSSEDFKTLLTLLLSTVQ